MDIWKRVLGPDYPYIYSAEVPSMAKRVFVESGEEAPESGYYIYKRHPSPGHVSCLPAKKEKIILLARGEQVPRIESCNGHPALYKLVIKTD